MSIFQQRLKELMEEKKTPEGKKIKPAHVAKATGLSPAAISKYLSDDKKQPEFTSVLKIAKFFNVSVEWLGGVKDVREPFEVPEILPIYEKLSFDSKKEVFDFASYLLTKETAEQTIEEECAVYEFPLLGKTAAGAGVINGDSLNETVLVHDIPKVADFALVVKGDSMEPVIKDGSLIFIKSQETVENGEIAIVDMDGEVTCKKVYFVNGDLELKSINQKYKPMHPKNARIIGKVII